MSVSFCLPHPVAVSAFMICRGVCSCTEMLWMCVLYVSFGSKVRLRTFGCVAMGRALLFIVRSRLLVYSAGSGVNRVQVYLNNVIITVDSLELNVMRIQLHRPVHRLQCSIICCSKEQFEDMIIPKSFRLLTLSIT